MAIAEAAPRDVERPRTDPERWRCSWTDGRERCHYPGSISSGTRGEGPWRCRFHFFCDDAVMGQRFIEESRDFFRGDAPPTEYQVQQEPGERG